MHSTKKIALVSVLYAASSLLTLPAAAAGVEEPVTKTLVWPDGTRYVGGVLDGKRSGKGTIFWQEGTRFVGQFENDMRNGPGTMILPDGTVYTGFFKNDELVDTEATIAASNASDSVELDEAETVSALGDTELPMEADSVSGEEMAEALTSNSSDNDQTYTSTSTSTSRTDEIIPQVDENDPVETTPEAAVETTAFVDPEPEPEPYESSYNDLFEADVTEVTAAVEDQLRETINLWGAAWSEQNVTQYLANYSSDFRVPNRQSRRNWEALRRSRLNRPRYINIDIDYQRFEFVETNVVDVFFRQSYRSNTYSDLTDKVLRMRKEGSDWKILIERSR